MIITAAGLALLVATQVGTAALAPVAGLPEIIVTARRLPESLATVPLSVTAFNANRLGQLTRPSLDELARFTPGFSFNSAAGRGPNSNRPTVRGLTTIRNGIASCSCTAGKSASSRKWRPRKVSR